MIRRAPRFAVLAALSFALAACAPDAGDAGDGGAEMAEQGPSESAAIHVAAEEQAIRERVEAWERAANESAEAFSRFYAPEGVLLPANQPAAEGREAIAEALGPMFESLDAPPHIEVVEIRVSAAGDLAVERGRYTLSGTGPDGAAFDDEGKYIVVWEKRDGEWMVVYDIFNSDRPPPGGEEM